MLENLIVTYIIQFDLLFLTDQVHYIYLVALDIPINKCDPLVLHTSTNKQKELNSEAFEFDKINAAI